MPPSTPEWDMSNRGDICLSKSRKLSLNLKLGNPANPPHQSVTGIIILGWSTFPFPGREMVYEELACLKLRECSQPE